MANTAVQIGLGFGIISTILNLYFGKRFIGKMVANPEVASQALRYMNIKAFHHPFLYLQFALSGTYRGLQDTKTPFMMVVIASLTNFALLIYFMNYMGMGVEGSAYAITIAEVISSMGMLVFLFRRKFLNFFNLFVVHSWRRMFNMVTEGFTLSTRTMGLLAMVIAGATMIERLGPIQYSAYEFIKNSYILLITIIESFGIALNSLISSSIGKGDVYGAKKVLYRVLFWTLFIMVLLLVTASVFRQNIVNALISNIDIQKLYLQSFPIFLCIMPINCFAAINESSMMAHRRTDIIAKAGIISTSVVLTIFFMI